MFLCKSTTSFSLSERNNKKQILISYKKGPKPHHSTCPLHGSKEITLDSNAVAPVKGYFSAILISSILGYLSFYRIDAALRSLNRFSNTYLYKSP